MARKSLPSPTVPTLSFVIVNSARPSRARTFKSEASTHGRGAGTTKTSPVSRRTGACSPSMASQHALVVRSANRRDDGLRLLAVDGRSDDLERVIALGLG